MVNNRNYSNAGLLLIRFLLGGLVAAHGLQKITHLFGGRGLAGGTEEFRNDGFRGGRFTALLGGGSQTGGGLLLATGLLTPLGVAMVVGSMTVAASVKLPKGLWVQQDGMEYPLVLILGATAIGLTGPGAWSLDRVASINWFPATGIAASAAGVLAALAMRRLLLQRADPQPTRVPAEDI